MGLQVKSNGNGYVCANSPHLRHYRAPAPLRRCYTAVYGDDTTTALARAGPSRCAAGRGACAPARGATRAGRAGAGGRAGGRGRFGLAAGLADPGRVAAALDADGSETPGVAYRRLGLYGYGKRPEPKSRRWTGTQVQKIVGDPVYTGTLVTGKTRRRVMNRHPVDVVPESERYVTEGAHPALVADGLWRAAQACLRTKEHLKGVGKSAPKSPFARGLLRRAECGTRSATAHGRRAAPSPASATAPAATGGG